MQRKPTKNTRGPNSAEKRFMSWVKCQPCCVLGFSGPSIAHHCEGATFKHNKVLVGHWFVIPLSEEADNIVTNGSRKEFRESFNPQSVCWIELIVVYPLKHEIPVDVILAIEDWGR